MDRFIVIPDVEQPKETQARLLAASATDHSRLVLEQAVVYDFKTFKDWARHFLTSASGNAKWLTGDDITATYIREVRRYGWLVLKVAV